jgi:hypothetical protein
LSPSFVPLPFFPPRAAGNLEKTTGLHLQATLGRARNSPYHDYLYLSESGDSFEPSVNQPTPDFDFLAVEQEQEAKRAKLDEIRQLLLERYRIVEWKRRGWMQNSLFPDLSDGVVEGVVRELELFSYSSQA